jgi:hypothetical protein
MGKFLARQMGQRKMQISGWSGSKLSANQHSDTYFSQRQLKWTKWLVDRVPSRFVIGE